MSKFNIFNQNISEDVRSIHEENLAQVSTLIDISNLINEAIEDKGINQTELAKKLGVTRGYVSRLLSGNENLSVKNVTKVLYILGKRLVFYTEDIVTHRSNSKIYNIVDYSANRVSYNFEKTPVSKDMDAVKWLNQSNNIKHAI